MILITVLSSFQFIVIFLTYNAEGKPAEIYHHYIQRTDCDHQDETDINLSRMVVKELDVEESDQFNVDDCLKCSIDESHERGVHGGYISCKCVKNEIGLVHGDMMVDNRTRRYMNYAYGKPTFERGTISGARHMWPKDYKNNVIIPYVLSGVFSRGSSLWKKFDRVIKVFHEKTCIRFVPRTYQSDYILPVDEGGCWSFVGKAGGKQKVSIGHQCSKDGIVMHELMHVIGFFHEQSRKDRDKYVSINLRNVLAGFEGNFDIAENVEVTNSPYDYESVMHYGSYSFTINSQKTITRRDGGSTLRMGQRDGMSAIDIQEINAKYCVGGSGESITTTTRPVVATTTPYIWRTTTTRPTTTTTTTTRPTVTISTDCSDKYSYLHCGTWQRSGYCGHTYQDFMHSYCKKTCGICDTGSTRKITVPKKQTDCKDKISGCSSIRSYCSSSYHKAWMEAYCASTCKFCLSSDIVTTTQATTTAAPRKISNAACGTIYRSSFYARIVGGEDAEAGSIPWQANIRFGQMSVCGGTLIGDRWILTAAHCVIGGPDDYTVLLGLQDRDRTDEAQVQKFGLSKIIRHDEYSPMSSKGPMLNDIAILELDRDAEYTNYVIKACLPHRSWNRQFTSFTASGWGDTTEAGDHSQTLQRVTLSLINKATCENWLGNEGYSIDPNAICAGEVTGGKDACQGDSGGPLTAESYGRNYVMGVVSWGIGCGREKHPGIYTQVLPHLDWINNVMNGL